MNPDGDFGFYKFIWSGADQGWGVYSYPPMYGVKTTFREKSPSPLEIKVIRSNWPRLANKSVIEAKFVIGQDCYTFGKWNLSKAELIRNSFLSKGIKAEIVKVPDYSIVNMKTRQAAIIRSQEIYDLVTQTLIDNGGEVIPHSGISLGGAIEVDDE